MTRFHEFLSWYCIFKFAKNVWIFLVNFKIEISDVLKNHGSSVTLFNKFLEVSSIYFPSQSVYWTENRICVHRSCASSVIYELEFADAQ